MRKMLSGLILMLCLGCRDVAPVPQAKRVWVMSVNNRSAVFQQTDGALEVYDFCDYPPLWKGLHLDIVMTHSDDDMWPCWKVQSAKPLTK